MFGDAANKITGKVNSQYDRVEYYFQLKRTNDSLVKANEILYNKLREDFNLPDTATKNLIDTLRIDSIVQYRRFEYLHAKVVSNSVNTENNFIVLYGDNVPSFKKDMGVVDVKNGVVGVITEVSGKYAVVMSLLHKDSKLNGKLLKGGETGTLSWNGKTPNLLTLTGITKGAKVQKGDSVITSGHSTYFPKGNMIGTVEEVYSETSTNNYTITVRTAVNFYNIEYAYAIINYQKSAIDSLLEKAKKQQ